MKLTKPLERGQLLKADAIAQLGGTTTAAAKLMNISYNAVRQWKPVLSDAISMRVRGVLTFHSAKRNPKSRSVKAVQGEIELVQVSEQSVHV